MGEDAQSTSAVALKVRKPEGIDYAYGVREILPLRYLGTTVKSPDPYLSPDQIATHETCLI